MKYLFKTTATMKYYNNKKWWIDGDIIRNMYIDSENVNDALKKYQEAARDRYGVEISNNALKNKDAMYIDTAAGAVQTGYVITAKTGFFDDARYRYTDQYIDLWIDISIIKNAFMEDAAK